MDGMITEISDRLREARQNCDLSQKALGLATDIHQSQIAMLELPKYCRHLTLAQAVRVATVLNVSLDWLATGKGEGPGNGR